MQQRERLTQGTVKIEVERHVGNGLTNKSLPTTYNIAFKGDYFRFVEDIGGQPAVHMVIRTPTMVIGRTYALGAPDNPTPIVIGDPKEMEDYLRYCFDPRVFGLVPCSTAALYAKTINDFLLTIDPAEHLISVDTQEPDEITVLLKTKAGVSQRVWLSGGPMSVVRSEIEGHHPKGLIVDRLEVKLKTHKSSKADNAPDIIFPEEVYFTRNLDGQTVLKERSRVVFARFDEDVPDRLFTLESFGVTPGTEIATRGDVRSRANGLDKIGSARPVNTRKNRATYLWLIAANLAIIAIGLLWLLLRRRAGARK